jgi:hypothetical protein
VGLADPRVIAMAYVEGYAYRTRAFWKRYPLRFLSTPRWENRLKGRLRGLKLFAARSAGVMDPVAVEAAGGGAEMLGRSYPPKEQYAIELNQLADRGVKVLLLYAGLDSNLVGVEQLEEMFGPGLRQRVDFEFLGGADHIFYRVEDRMLAVSTLAAWMNRCFPAKAAARPAAASAM